MKLLLTDVCQPVTKSVSSKGSCLYHDSAWMETWIHSTADTTQYFSQ